VNVLTATMSKHPALFPSGIPGPLLDMSNLAQTMPASDPAFNLTRHITYWLRCARTFLPNPYESGDASRMLFGFFIVSALDLLGLLDPDLETGKAKITDEEKKGWVDWIYHCQHPSGGFRGFTGTIVEGQESEWDPANLPSTFFALCILLILGDDLERVEREASLVWVKKLQRKDGSFGEVLGGRAKIEGGKDLRFCCCAAGILHILRDGDRHDDPMTVFDESAMVEYIASCQSYEGGFSEGPFREAHSGLNYCAIGALSFLGTLSSHDHTRPMTGDLGEIYGKHVDLNACTNWMLQRQTTYIEDDEVSSSDDEQINGQTNSSGHPKPQDVSTSPADLVHAGFNGRINKIADTCYAFWNVGALAILEKQHLIDQERLRRYLLGKMQHAIGGFGKGVGEPPDVLHAYLGLATLSILGKDELKHIDPTLCISVDAADRIGRLRWKREDEEE
jgi:geranylgeranyl transferase type-1 subunit beta